MTADTSPEQTQKQPTFRALLQLFKSSERLVWDDTDASISRHSQLSVGALQSSHLYQMAPGCHKPDAPTRSSVNVVR